MAVGFILLVWVFIFIPEMNGLIFFKSISNPKIIFQNPMQIRKPNLVLIIIVTGIRLGL